MRPKSAGPRINPELHWHEEHFIYDIGNIKGIVLNMVNGMEHSFLLERWQRVKWR